MKIVVTVLNGETGYFIPLRAFETARVKVEGATTPKKEATSTPKKIYTSASGERFYYYEKNKTRKLKPLEATIWLNGVECLYEGEETAPPATPAAPTSEVCTIPNEPTAPTTLETPF